MGLRQQRKLLLCGLLLLLVPPSTFTGHRHLQYPAALRHYRCCLACRLLFKTESVEKRLAIALLALDLHVDPGGVLLHSQSLIQRLRSSGTQDWFSSGSWRLGRQPAGLHTGKRVWAGPGLCCLYAYGRQQ